ncbi:ABC transporter ATP-binding protein [Acidimangrovimonas sediminis]|uniref:ABC transporter ATP-binding protein n=1 Tax=Acidimangrovimonas sediminis TaxID=2056283 RepID=UPI000C80BC4D|nr:ABC transporter ATP-binding protein [Acidimangrovimonas sediminis]
MPAVNIENLRVAVTRGGPEVVKGISLTIERGETVCLVGESGSGKSVTSLAAMGLLPKGSLEIRGGKIEIDGEDALAASPAALRRMRASKMAMIFQEPMTALNPVMRVGDQIDEVLKEHTKMPAPEREKRVLDILEQVGLPDIARVRMSFPHQLSGGQRQRIMIAMALVLEPVLLIADEPTTALDVTTQKQILKLIKDLQVDHGTAVLFITHDMGVVSEIADRVYVMNHGDMVEDGPIGALLRTPQKEYTRKLLSAVPSLVPRPGREKPQKAPVLDVNNLEKIYGATSLFAKAAGTRAVDDVSFNILPGRTLGIVGESGSGKSTVARCIMRLIDPSKGQVRIDGTDIVGFSRQGLQPHRAKFQMVFQDPYRSLNPRLTVGESIIEAPVNYGISRTLAMERARELMVEVGLPADAVGRYPHQFSGGQRQRIAIARAVAMEPKLLVADEAVSALDVSVQAQVLDLLDRLQRKSGFGMLFITHDLRVAAQICDEVVVMSRGKIVEAGPADRVLGAPSDPYTRSLIDAAPGRDWDFANFRPMARAEGA